MEVTTPMFENQLGYLLDTPKKQKTIREVRRELVKAKRALVFDESPDDIIDCTREEPAPPKKKVSIYIDCEKNVS